MADDPNRDLLPVKEGSCIETCRGSTIDTRDRHAIVNLDRYELEDRYLRMHDEFLELKKLSNTQEDKIKRLATKLMRASATPGSCLAATLDSHNDKNRQDSLELENAKLKDKIAVLRSQILNHKLNGRSPSRSRRLQICSSSGPTTCRSDIGRIRSSTSNIMRENDRESEKDAKNYLAKIDELKLEKKEMTLRIDDLEAQIASHEAGNQRQKVAENVEFIRVWRQMKLQNEELVKSEARNVSLEEQIHDLKKLVDEKTRNNKDITTALLEEKKKIADMDEQLTRAKDSQLSLREKDEQIRDLMSEMKILHQHNAELIALSTKYSNAEMENMELRKKISEQLSDNLSLKSAFSNDQANITALQAANQRLMSKLHELQTNIDTLTIQLKSFQSQNERQERSSSERRISRTVDRQTSTDSLMEKIVKTSTEVIPLAVREICKNCCKSSRDLVDRKSDENFINRGVQTDNEKLEICENSGIRESVKKSPRHCCVPRTTTTTCDRSFKHENGNLTPEEMIKLLEDAQINTPLDVQNISRIRRNDSTIMKNCVNTGDSRQSSFTVTKKSCQTLSNEPWQLLLALYKILRENVANSSKIHDDVNTCVRDNDYRDENNNDTKISMDHQREEYCKNMENIIVENRKNANERRSDTRQKIYRPTRKKISKESLKNLRIENLENHKTRTSNLVDQYTETSDCCCEDNDECNYEVDCGYACAPSISVGELTGIEERIDNCECDIGRDSFKNFVNDLNNSIQKTFDNFHKSRATRVNGKPSGLYKTWQKPRETRNSLNRSSNENNTKFTVCRRARCNLHDDKSNETKIERIERYGVMRVKKNLQQFNNECLDEKSVMEDLRCVSCCKKYFDDETIVREGESFPMIITNDQGLLEIHIIRLKLASMATDIFRKQKNINDLSLFITWDLWNNEQPFTPTVKYSKFNFNSSLIYRLTSLFDFFDRILGQTISLRIHISHRRNNYLPVARAYLSIKDILDYPQNKLHYVANFTSTLPCSGDHNFGQLSLWIRLSCDVDKVKMFRERRGISGDSLIGKKIEKISNDNEKKFRRSSRDSKIKDELSSSRLDDVEIGSLTKLNRETSLRSENGRMGKEIFLSSRLNDKNSSSLLGASRISRNSKNSAKKRFISEASSSTLGRSFVNGKSMNNASAAESYLTISPEISTVKRSDSSMIRAMEDEDTTSEEFRNEDKKLKEGSPTKSLLEEGRKSKEYNDRVETDSVNEFNNLIRNGTILSPRESRSSVQDLGNVFTDHNWQKYRKRSMAAEPKSLRPSIVPTEADGRSKNSYTVSDHSTSSSEAVIIRIESISLFQRSSLLDDPEIHQIYVEFTFLGYRGVELETISVPKPLSSDTRAYFNYMRKFELDEEEHSVQRNIMRDIMTENENPTIKFIIVSEPLIEEMETKECEEVGYAYFNIRDHILRGLSKNVSLTIMSVVKKQPIGILKITLLGAEAIRRCMSDL